MKAARLYSAGDLRVEDIAAPGAPGPGEVRIAVRAAGICGSDLHNFRTGQWISRSPSTAGHEFAGVVTDVGQGVAGFAPGDTVVADSRWWCGECEACRAGRPNVCTRLGFVGEVCDGGFAEVVVLPARLVLKHEPTLDPGIAAMAEPLAVALHAVHKQAVPAVEPLLVVGCGTIGGLAALLISRSRGGPLLVSDRNRERAALVAEMTGAMAVDLDPASVHAALKGRALRYAFDATGNAGVLRSVLSLLAGGGSVALVGISHAPADLDLNLLVEREISLVGCHAFIDELLQAVAMLPALAPALKQLIDAEITIDEVPAAYARLLAGEARGLKTLLRFEGTDA
jgi:(R,R)-butanediol dehydrogenase/meso-butanediol dehydrogenase/diacetyl reductase